MFLQLQFEAFYTVNLLNAKWNVVPTTINCSARAKPSATYNQITGLCSSPQPAPADAAIPNTSINLTNNCSHFRPNEGHPIQVTVNAAQTTNNVPIVCDSETSKHCSICPSSVPQCAMGIQDDPTILKNGNCNNQKKVNCATFNFIYLNVRLTCAWQYFGTLIFELFF